MNALRKSAPGRRLRLKKASPKNVHSRPGAQPNDGFLASAAVMTMVLSFASGGTNVPE